MCQIEFQFLLQRSHQFLQLKIQITMLLLVMWSILLMTSMLSLHSLDTFPYKIIFYIFLQFYHILGDLNKKIGVALK